MMPLSAIERKQCCLNIVQNQCQRSGEVEMVWQGVSRFTSMSFRTAPEIQGEVLAKEAAIKDKILLSLVSRVFGVYQSALASYSDEELKTIRKVTDVFPEADRNKVLGATMREVIFEVLEDLEKS